MKVQTEIQCLFANAPCETKKMNFPTCKIRFSAPRNRKPLQTCGEISMSKSLRKSGMVNTAAARRLQIYTEGPRAYAGP